MLPPPSQLPPPSPSQPQPRSGRRTVWLVIGAIAIATVVAVVAAANKDDKSTPDRKTDAFSYQWSNGVCNADGYSGRFTNTDTKDFNGKLWAVGKRGGATVARDSEAVFKLSPGESTSVEFVWSEDSVDSCSLESVEWSY